MIIIMIMIIIIITTIIITLLLSVLWKFAEDGSSWAKVRRHAAPRTPLLMWLKVLLPVPKMGFLGSSFQYPLEVHFQWVQGQWETVGSRCAGNPRLWASRAGNPRPGNPRAWRQVWRTCKQIQEQKGFTSHFTMSLSSHLLGFVNIFFKRRFKGTASPSSPLLSVASNWHGTTPIPYVAAMPF